MGISLNSLKMYAKGFKKVALKDTKGVLNKTNNFKWVKNFKGVQTTVLPSGTQIDTSLVHKVTIKPNQEVYLRRVASDGSYKVLKGKKENGLLKDVAVLKQKTPQEVLQEKAKAAAEALNKKREAFIKNFNAKFERKTIKHENGSVSKITTEKESGRLRRWFNKDAQGNVKIGTIDYPMNGLSKVTTLDTPNKVVIRETVPLMGTSSSITKAKDTQEILVKTSYSK